MLKNIEAIIFDVDGNRYVIPDQEKIEQKFDESVHL